MKKQIGSKNIPTTSQRHPMAIGQIALFQGYG